MANTIKLKSGSGNNPSASDLVVGEVALRTDGNPKLFTKNDAGNVVEIGLDVASTATFSDGIVLPTTAKGIKFGAGGSVNDDAHIEWLGGNNSGYLRISTSDDSDSASFPNEYIEFGDYPAQGKVGTFTQHVRISRNRFLVRTGTASSVGDRFNIADDGTVDIYGNLDVGAGVDVTGDITVSGTVDGVDIATRDTLFGGLTSSSGVLSNGVTATTQSAGDNSTKLATTAYTDTAISNLVDSSPSTLNTLNELAAALGDDANFSTTVTNSIATKMPLAGGQFTGNITFSGTQTVDGRDLSVDGSKLDGIESGATADQTASEIKSLLSDQDITTTGQLSAKDLILSDTTPVINLNDSTANPDYQINNTNGVFNIRDTTNSVDRLVVNTDGHVDVTGNLDVGAGLDVTGAITATSESTINAALILGGSSVSGAEGGELRLTQAPNGSLSGDTVKIDIYNNKLRIFESGSPSKGFHLPINNGQASVGSQIWTSSTDGSGSGLDADTLDGVQGSSYLRSDTNDTFSGNLTVTGIIYLQDQIRIGDDAFIEDYNAANSIRIKGNQDNNKGFIAFGSQTKKLGCDGASAALTYDGHEVVTQNSNLNASNLGSGTIPAARLSASDLLTKIKTVDGSGSGLDADTLDGMNLSSTATANTVVQRNASGTVTATTFSGSGASLTNIPAGQLTGTLPALDGSNLTGLTVNNANTLDNLDSTQFLRSDQADTISANLTSTAASTSGLLGAAYHTNYFGLKTSSQTLSSEYMIISANADTFISASSGYKVRIRNGANDSTNELQIGSGNDALTWRGNKVFHAGNDGSGSGLDADTLDGVQGASFVRSDAADIISGDITFTDNGQYPVVIGSASGMNDGRLLLRGSSNPYIRFRQANTDKAYIQMHSNGNFYIVNQATDESLKIGSGSGGLTFTHNGTESVLFHAGNDGSGSGLDADTLDGVQGASFVRSDADDTLNGHYTISDSDNEKLVLAGSSNPLIRWKESTTNKAYIQWNSSGFLGLYNQEDASSLLIKDNITFSQDGITYYKVWHAGNDGSGSGLDADVLRGIGGQKYLTSYNDATGGWEDSNRNFRVTTGGGAAGLVFHESDGTFAFQIYGDGSAQGFLTYNWGTWDLRKYYNGQLYLRVSDADYLAFHAGNDGSGSGLDADTLDGVQANSFVRSDLSDTLTGGTYTFSSSTDQKLILQGSSNPYIRLKEGTTEKAYWQFNSDGHVYFWNQESNRGLRLGTALHYYDGSYRAIWHANNDGSGSGLDADTVDGIQASSFLRSDTADNFSGTLTNNSKNEDPTVSNGAINLQPSTDGGRTGIVFRSKTNNTSDFAYVWYYDDLDAYRTSGNSTENGCLLIGIQNDAANATSSDFIAIESSGDVFINPGIRTGIKGANSWNSTYGNLYIGNAATKYKVLHEGNLGDQNRNFTEGITLGTTGKGIKFGAGTAANDDAHIEWLGGSNDGKLRISTSDDNGTERIEFGDYDTTDKGGGFELWSYIKRSDYYVNVSSTIDFNAHGGGMYVYRSTTGGGIIHFQSNVGGTNSLKSYINESGSLVSASDYRLKTDVAEITNGTELVKNLKPSTYKWKHDTTTTHHGFIAHELQEVLPNCVDGNKDQMKDDNETPHYQFYTDQELIPVLTAALKEAIARIEDLESKVNS